MLEFLVCRERKVDMQTVFAKRRLERLETEKDEQEYWEHNASLEESPADKTKVTKLVFDMWFIDKGFGFGTVPTGEVVFIHASVIGTDAWVQVVSDARAEGEYRARNAWGRNAWEEKDKEKANRMAQQVKRAAALTAELAAQSERKVSTVCDHPFRTGRRTLCGP